MVVCGIWKEEVKYILPFYPDRQSEKSIFYGIAVSYLILTPMRWILKIKYFDLFRGLTGGLSTDQLIQEAYQCFGPLQ